LNNIDKFSENLKILVSELNSEFKTILDAADHKSCNMFQLCLSELQALGDELSRLQNRAISKRCKPMTESIPTVIDRLATVSYELKEGQLSDVDASGDSFGNATIICLKKQLSIAKSSCNKGVLAAVIKFLAKNFALCLETSIKSKRFSFWGGVQFEKDLRKVLNYLSSQTELSLREEFSRLTQIAALLQLEQLEEISDLWSDWNDSWKLSADDVKAVLRCRQDFSPSRIGLLKLAKL